ncbi:MAG: glycosyltransferase [Rhodobacteraceae bacterium]|nr:glycosyltransferase [Paracoccaceae bacterium]
MADRPEISVIVVSRDRPDDLRKMLSCLRFQDVSGFEVIVVTNTPGALEGAQHPAPLRLFDCDEANIAVARNVGLFAAKGQFVAFCDDDALPDPSWLRRLLAPFRDPDIGGTGGFTRGRNGISLQWGAVETDLLGEAHPLEIAADSELEVFAPSQKTAPVMIGTNCAFRAPALKQIGGFDAAFAYYLDDSDISLRLSQAGWKLAIVPHAQVHHGFAAGPYRAQNRVPKTLHPHGKSKAVFCRKHAPEAALEPALTAFKALQFKRLEKQFLAGLMEPRVLPSLIKSLEDGYQTGRHFLLKSMPIGKKPAAGKSLILGLKPGIHVLLAGRKADQKWLGDMGKALAKGGIITTTLILSRSPAFMKANFSERGYWTLSGGQFGKSSRSDPLLQYMSFNDKVQAEIQRLAAISPVNYVAYPQRSGQADIFSPQNDAMSCLNGFVVESV